MTGAESVLLVVLAVPTLLSASYPLDAWLAFRRRSAGALAPATAGQSFAPTPPRSAISVVVPLRGAEAQLESNFRALIAQDLPAGSEILACVESESDPCMAVIRPAIEASAGRARLVVAGDSRGELGKMRSLLAGVTASRGTWLVFADSDVRLPDAAFLRAFVAPLADPRTGLVTCYPAYREARDLPSLILAGLIHTDLLGLFAAQAAWGGLTLANGACMALSREVLIASGGLDPLRGRLLMDAALARRVRATGRRVVLHREPVVVPRERMRWSELVEQSHRWHVALLHGLPPMVFAGFCWLRSQSLIAAALALLAPSPPVRILALIALLARLGAAITLERSHFRMRHALRFTLALPLAELAGALAWLSALIDARVTWRGRRYRIGRDASAVAIESPGAKASRVERSSS